MKRKAGLCCFLLGSLLICQVYAKSQDRLAQYQYEDTRQLVALVEDAAALIEQKGQAAFLDFAVPNSRWLNDKHYLFVYTPAGESVFHPMEPGIVGKNLSQFHDLDGRPVVTQIAAIGKKTEPNAYGWVFYLWGEHWGTEPQWKSSYIRKAIAPDGQIYVVGSGQYNLKVEKIFVQERVDMAAELILTQGKEAAFRELRKNSSPLYLADSAILVIDQNGYIVVDPLFPNIFERNCFTFRDKTGRAIAEEASAKLEQTDRIWLQYIWSKSDSKRPARKLTYIRKVKVGNETFFVMAGFFPAAPIWMRQ